MRPLIRLVPACLLAILVLAAPAAGRDGPDDAPARMADAKRITQRALRLTLQGQQAGGVLVRVGHLEGGALLMETDMLLKIRRGNGGEADVFVMRQHGLDYYDASGRLRWSHGREEEAGVVKRTTCRYTDEAVTIHFTGPASTFEKTLPLPESFDNGLPVFHRLRRALEKGEKTIAEYVTLDAENQVFEPKTLTLVKKTTYEHGGASHPGYLLHEESNEGKAIATVDDAYMPMHVTMMGGAIEAQWIDESPFEFGAGGWEISSFLPVEGKAPMTDHLERLELTVTETKRTATAEDDRPLFVANRYQSVRKEGEAWKLVLASTRLPDDETVPQRPVPVEDEAIRRFLAPTPQSQSDHASIVAEAAEIVGGETDAREAAARIVRWVYRTLDKASGARGNATAVEVLASGVGDCTEHAALTVALCRAAGIPARNVGGIVYVVMHDGTPAAGFHAWSEVWLGRWVGVDATIPEVGTAARYILMDVDEPGEANADAKGLRAVLGGLRLRIDAYTVAGGTRTVLPR